MAGTSAHLLGQNINAFSGSQLTRERDVQNILHGIRNQVRPPARQPGALEDIHDVIHHNIHPRQLAPHLQTASQRHPSEHLRLQQIHITLRPFLPLKLHLLTNLLKLEPHQLRVGVSPTVQIRQNRTRLLGSAVVHEPARGLGEPEHAEGEDDGGDHLEGPGDAEGGGAGDVGAAELDEVLDEDPPGDGPLLEGDDPPADGGSGDFGLVEGYSCGCEADLR
jgi:hypothetical protein